MKRQEIIVLSSVCIFVLVVFLVGGFAIFSNGKSSQSLASQSDPALPSTGFLTGPGNEDQSVKETNSPVEIAATPNHESPDSGSVEPVGDIPDVEKIKKELIVVPVSMKLADVDECMAAANAKNKEFEDSNLTPFEEPIKGLDCVLIKTKGRGAMEFYPNGYGLFIDKGEETLYCFTPKKSTEINLRVWVHDANSIMVSSESPNVTLRLVRIDRDQEWIKSSSWKQVENAEEVERFAFNCLERSF